MFRINHNYFTRLSSVLVLSLLTVATIAPSTSFGAPLSHTSISEVKVVIHGSATVIDNGKNISVAATVTNTGTTTLSDISAATELSYSQLIDTSQPGQSSLSATLPAGTRYLYIPQVLAINQDKTTFNLDIAASHELSLVFKAPLPFGANSDTVKVAIYDQAGIVLGQSSAGLTGASNQSQPLLQIATDGFSLATAGGKKISTTGDATLDPESSLTAGLTALNSGSLPITGHLVVTTYNKSSHRANSSPITVIGDQITITPKSSRVFTSIFKAPSLPQAYVITAQVIGKDGELVSPLRTAYFTVKGASASIGRIVATTHLEWYGKPTLMGSIVVTGSPDQKTPFTGKLLITAHKPGSNDVVAQQELPVSLSNKNSSGFLTFAIPYSRYLDKNSLIIETKLESSTGQIIDTANAEAVNVAVPFSNQSKKIVAILLGVLILALLTFLLFRIRKAGIARRSMGFLTIAITIISTFSAAIPRKALAGDNDFTYNSNPNNISYTDFARKNLGIGISNQTIGQGASTNPYTSYVGSDKAGLVISSAVISPSFGPEERLQKVYGDIGTCIGLTDVANRCAYLLGNGSFDNGSVIQIVPEFDPYSYVYIHYSLDKYIRCSIELSVQYGCIPSNGNFSPTTGSNIPNSTLQLTNVAQHNKTWSDTTGTVSEDCSVATYTGTKKPALGSSGLVGASFKYVKDNGCLTPRLTRDDGVDYTQYRHLDAPWGDYRVAYGETMHDGVSRYFQYPSAKMTINNQSDLVSCSNYINGGVTGITARIYNNVSNPQDAKYLADIGHPQPVISPDPSNPKDPRYFNVFERNKHGDYIVSLYACVGLHPNNTVGKAQISLSAADYLFNYDSFDSNGGKLDSRGLYFNMIYAWSNYDGSTSDPASDNNGNGYDPWEGSLWGGSLRSNPYGNYHPAIRNRTWWPLIPGMTKNTIGYGGLTDSNAGNTSSWVLGGGLNNPLNMYSNCTEFTIFGDGINPSQVNGGNSRGSGSVPPSQTVVPPVPNGVASDYSNQQHSCPAFEYPNPVAGAPTPTLTGNQSPGLGVDTALTATANYGSTAPVSLKIIQVDSTGNAVAGGRSDSYGTQATATDTFTPPQGQTTYYEAVAVNATGTGYSTPPLGVTPGGSGGVTSTDPTITLKAPTDAFVTVPFQFVTVATNTDTLAISPINLTVPSPNGTRSTSYTENTLGLNTYVAKACNTALVCKQSSVTVNVHPRNIGTDPSVTLSPAEQTDTLPALATPLTASATNAYTLTLKEGSTLRNFSPGTTTYTPPTFTDAMATDHPYTAEACNSNSLCTQAFAIIHVKPGGGGSGGGPGGSPPAAGIGRFCNGD